VIISDRLLADLDALRDGLLTDADLADRARCVATATAYRDAARRLASIIGAGRSTPHAPGQISGPAELRTVPGLSFPVHKTRFAGGALFRDWRARQAGERPEGPE